MSSFYQHKLLITQLVITSINTITWQKLFCNTLPSLAREALLIGKKHPVTRTG